MERARVQSVSKCFLLSFYLSSQFWYKDAHTHTNTNTHSSLLSVFWQDSVKRHGFWNWRRDRAMQNILCGSRLTQLGRQLKQPHARAHTLTNASTSMNHLLTGDSWGSQYKLLVNSPKNRMGFRLWGRKASRDFKKRKRNCRYYRITSVKLLSCF